MSVAGRGLTAVTVTYGSRWSLLTQLLSYLEAAPLVDDVVVVDNGSEYSVAERIDGVGFTKPVVVRLEENAGSAAGFARGIAVGLGREREWIWLLDDDNLPRPDALETLLACYRAERRVGRSADGAKSELPALLALRPDRVEFVRALTTGQRLSIARNSFMAFHILERVSRGLERVFRRRTTTVDLDVCERRVVVDFAPYGGLLLGRGTIEAIGLPDQRFVLYADDYEYSHRITRLGGDIVLCGGAVVDDLEVSWNRRSHGPHRLLDPASDERKIFFSVRNQVCWERTCFVTSRSVYSANILVYLAALILKGPLDGLPLRHVVARMRVILNAVRDGLRMARAA